MSTNNDSNENGKYKEDIDTIKNILIKVDEKPIYENWVFTVAGILFIIGSIINFICYRLHMLTIGTSFVRIWLPVSLMLIFLEPIALVRRMAKEALPVFSRTIVKFYTGMIGISGAAVFLIIVLLKADLMHVMPVCVISLWSVYYFYISQMSYTHLTLHGFILVAIGIVLYNTCLSTEMQFILTGLTVGLSMLIAGITETVKEKRKNG